VAVDSGNARDTTPGSWDREVDVAVVGFGGAGATAAIEAADSGADTLVVDRFTGGGATRISGGIYYAGGGTELQADGGYDDTPDEMFDYLRCETEGEAVSDEVLRAFCEESVANFEWLRAQGVPFPQQGFAPIKTSYPSDETTLYFSGNEKSPPYSDRAKPAPRGHRPFGKGLTGGVLFEALRRRALRVGVEVLYRSKATRLVSDETGRVVGLEVATLSSNPAVRALHATLFGIATYGGAMSDLLLTLGRRGLTWLEKVASRTLRVRARGGVVIAAGGFIYNPEWSREHIPRYSRTMRLGTAGDDGAGIALGMAAGASVRRMERGTAWMFINPPAGLAKGILLDRTGVRICNEELYGAALGERIAEFHDGRAILLLDRNTWRQARDQIVREHKATFQTLMGGINLYFNNVKASSLEELEDELSMPSGSLTRAVASYNAGVEARKDDVGKSAEFLEPLVEAPFYAVDCDTDNGRFLTPSISLGGLDIDGLTGSVLGGDGRAIPGLYAAGRSAVGVCSQHYVSGLSIADCIFGGRRAGRSCAEASRTEHGSAG